MNNKNLIRAFLLLSALVACGVARAKTVALWPLEVDSNNIGLRCAVNPDNDFAYISGHFSTTGMEAQWELPPNPDTSRHAFEPVSRSSVHETFASSGGNSNGFLYNNHSGIYVRRDKDFTVEGYIKVLCLPESNTWAFVVGAYGADYSDNNNCRWTLSLRRRPEDGYACSWILWGVGTSDTVLYRYADEEASYAITNTWLHVALVHEALPASGGQDHWKLYLNGTFAGESWNKGYFGDSTPRFEIGARLLSGGNQIEAAFDYWRISDKMLEPSEFLCAGEGGMSAPAASPTVAYWPLGVTETGGIDCRDAVGHSPLTGGFYGAVYTATRMMPNEDCAFTGNPPNPTVTLSGGNAGCIQGSDSYACLEQNAVGAMLNVTSNFTVEGWFCPRICERSPKMPNGEACCYLLGTRPDASKGWVLQYRATGIDRFQFDLYCVDGSGVLRNNVVFAGDFDMNTWYDKWRHVALTYNATGGTNGYGLWTLYIDGEQYGAVGNPRTPVAITDARPFTLGGRTSKADYSFQGKIDCARVCAAVLSPNQFLNATNNAAAATDVVGFWPLNAENGAYPDLRDVSGKNNHFASRANYYAQTLATADPDNAPTITNPDKTPTFRGDSSKVNGSVRFRNPDAATDNHRATFMTGSTEATIAVTGGRNFTFECYWYHRRRTASASGYQEVFFCPSSDGTTARIRFFRKTDGFYIWENLNTSSALADTLIPNTSDSDLEYDRWYHVALVHTIEPVDDVAHSMWRIYLDGSLIGTASKAYNGYTSTCNMLYVGGRYWTDKNSVIGNLSSIRLSDCALDPSEFLCATPAASAKPEPTVGYWPIDSTAPGLANLADEEYPLVADGTAAGQAEPARLSIPNKNALTNVVTGAARQNHGSYALGAGGTLAAASIGFDMAGPKPFTVEGWLKWTPAAGTADEDLITVGDALTGNGGLRIFFDKTDETPKLRVFARGAWPCTPYVDGAFDADLTPLAGTWAHVAIAYDISDGEGTWTLYIEGKQVGQVKNFYHPTSIDYCRGGDFRIGSTTHPLSAAVDMWRVSTVAYAPEDLLYAPPAGMLILFR